MARKKANNGLLAILAGLIVLVCLGMWYAGKVEKEGIAAQQPRSEAPSATEESDDAASTTRVKSGETAPDFTVAMTATWCPPCRMELSRVQEDILDRFAGQEFVFLPVSRGEKPEEVEAFRQENGYTFPMGLDPRKTVYDLYATNYIPRNFLIDREGRVVKTSAGYDEAEFSALIEAVEQAIQQR